MYTLASGKKRGGGKKARKEKKRRRRKVGVFLLRVVGVWISFVCVGSWVFRVGFVCLFFLNPNPRVLSKTTAGAPTTWW